MVSCDGIIIPYEMEYIHMHAVHSYIYVYIQVNG